MIEINSELEMKKLGAKIGDQLKGGEVIQLVGDIGAGKTTLVKGIAEGLGVSEDVQSPSYTLSRIYSARDDLRLAHYDFYRLDDAGVMANELDEDISDQHTITIIEWADIIRNVLPKRHVTINIKSVSESSRQLLIDDPERVLPSL